MFHGKENVALHEIMLGKRRLPEDSDAHESEDSHISATPPRKQLKSELRSDGSSVKSHLQLKDSNFSAKPKLVKKNKLDIMQPPEGNAVTESPFMNRTPLLPVIKIQKCGHSGQQTASWRSVKRITSNLGATVPSEIVDKDPTDVYADQKKERKKGYSGMMGHPDVSTQKSMANVNTGHPSIVTQKSTGNFVKLRMNGKGGKSRRFINRTSMASRKGYKKRKWKKGTEELEPDMEVDGTEMESTVPVVPKTEVCLNEEAIEAVEFPTEDNLLKVLKDVFGYSSFRNGQLETIQRVLSGESTMVVLPTGAGKSLCYQLPAYLLPGITLVIGPLVALMIDQLDHLPAAIPGAILNSTQTVMESSTVIEKLRAGVLKVLFISPERLLSENFLSVLMELSTISLAVIDEAHCVSQWSHNFRPSYSRLGNIFKYKVKPRCILAMTATATKETKSSILDSLGIPSNNVLDEGDVPHNLTLTVSRCETNKLHALIQLLKTAPFSDARSIIIYVKFQNEADTVCSFLQGKGINAESYHAGKRAQARRDIQKKFCQNKLRVVVATVAFGMGLDKSDIRAVIHYGLPGSLEHYVQEVGRAGRDGNPAFCHLFLDNSSYLKSRSLAYSDGADEYTINKLLCRIFESGSDAQMTALIVDSTCKELDLKEEVIATVLAYLEVGEEQLLTLFSPVKATCTMYFHKSTPHMLAEKNALVGGILQRSKEKNGQYVISLPCLAADLNVKLMDIQKELQILQSAGEIGYELKDEAFCFKVLRVPHDICALTSRIANQLSHAEACKVKKLDAMYRAASLVIGHEPYAPMETSIQKYFDSEEYTLDIYQSPDFVKSTSSYLRADVKVFLRSNSQMDFTGRAIARIFHGLGSPMYPVSMWSKNHFWGRHENVDFHVIKEIATSELISRKL